MEPFEIIALARSAGLETIEWGADVHVPPGDLRRATAVRGMTTQAGLTVASYGTYLRLGSSAADEHQHVLRTAHELGASRIRVWAGRTGSAATNSDEWAAVVKDARALTDAAAAFGITVGVEFHDGTLTDSAESTTRLLSDVDRAGCLGTYWQPPLDLPTEDALAGLHLLSDHVVAVHAFSWWPSVTRMPLIGRADLWQAVVRELHERGADTDVLLEFVQDDSVQQLIQDASALRALTAPYGGALLPPGGEEPG